MSQKHVQELIESSLRSHEGYYHHAEEPTLGLPQLARMLADLTGHDEITTDTEALAWLKETIEESEETERWKDVARLRGCL
jgi:homoserine acetyltransferase